METKQSRNSRFVSWPGLLTLLFFSVTAIYFKAGILAAFLAFFFLLCLGSRGWSRGVLAKIECSVQTEQNCCHAGETMTLDLKIRNRSFFPMVWLDLILPAGGKKALIRSEEDTEDSMYQIHQLYEPQAGIRERFVWLLWQQEICWQETVRTLRRGWMEIDGVQLQAGDGFGLSACQSWKMLPAALRLIVYPKVVPVAVQPFLKIMQDETAGKRGQTEDITILKSSRPYQPGDPVKRINWRMLAGSGRMEVKIYETVMPGCAAFLLDLASCIRMVEVKNAATDAVELKPVLQKPLMEQLISLTASCMQAALGAGIPVALVIPSYGSREEAVLLPNPDEDGLSRYLEALAMVDYQGEEAIFPYERFWQISHRLGTCYVCSCTDERLSWEDLAQTLGRSRVRRIVLTRESGEDGEFECMYAENLVEEPLS
jgi:uncharacterized protein (DUF58 family)